MYSESASIFESELASLEEEQTSIENSFEEHLGLRLLAQNSEDIAMDNSVSSSTLVATNETCDKPKDTSLSIVDNYTVTNDRILDSNNAAIQATNSSANISAVKHWYSDKVYLIQCFVALVIIALLSIILSFRTRKPLIDISYNNQEPAMQPFSRSAIELPAHTPTQSRATRSGVQTRSARQLRSGRIYESSFE
jgi:hypothetical protein